MKIKELEKVVERNMAAFHREERHVNVLQEEFGQFKVKFLLHYDLFFERIKHEIGNKTSLSCCTSSRLAF